MKITAHAKRVAAIAKVFGVDQVDPEDVHYTNFLYDRRNCAVVRNGKFRKLRYEIEAQDLEEAISKMISKTLDRIHHRDGSTICEGGC
jgi:hypothetical protein